MRGPRYYLVLGLYICTCCTCFSDRGESLSLRGQLLYEIYEKEQSNKPPDAADFFHVDIILSWLRYFIMKSMYYLLEV